MPSLMYFDLAVHGTSKEKKLFSCQHDDWELSKQESREFEKA